MASVSLTQGNKTEILQAVTRELYNATKLKAPKQPDIEAIAARAYNNWFDAEIKEHLDSPLLNLLAIEPTSGAKYKLPKALEINYLPNLKLKYHRGTVYNGSIEGTQFYLDDCRMNTISQTELDQHKMQQQSFVQYKNTLHNFTVFDTKQQLISNSSSWNTTTEYKTKHLQEKYYDNRDQLDISEYNDKLNTALEKVIATVTSITQKLAKISTSNKFRKEMPQLINFLPQDVLDREEEAKPKYVPKPKQPVEEAGEIDLNNIAKDIAFSKIMGK